MRVSTRISKVGAAAIVASVAVLRIAAPAHAVVSGANGRVFFGSNQNGGTYNIWSVEPNGTGATPLTSQASNAVGAQRASVSGDGSKVAFDEFDDIAQSNSKQIWIMNGDGSGQTQLTHTGDNVLNVEPGISPNGTEIAFMRETQGPGSTGFDIWTMDANGANQTQLTSTNEDDKSPEFSPDGTEIVFVRATGSNQIWLMDANGSNAHNLLNNPGVQDTGPSWSTDGTQVVYAESGNASSADDGLYVMNSDGTSATQLLDSGGHHIIGLDPTWSPDGTTIAFYAVPSGAASAGIYTVPSTGGSDPMPLLVTGSDFSSMYPSWAAVPAPNTFIDSGPSGGTNDPTPTFTFHSNDPSATFQCKVDSASVFTSCTSPHTLAHLDDASHTFRVRAKNSAGVDPTPASRTFTVRTAAVSESGGTLTITAATGAKDDLVITRPSISTLRVTDAPSGGAYTGSGVHAASAGCTRVGDYRVDCNASGITLIQASSGDQTDKITNNANLASLLNGGAAADLLTGGSTHDVITGGSGADVMIGMNGNDSIHGRDLIDDTTINCDGGTSSGLNDSADLDLSPKDSPATGCENVTRH